MAAKYLLRKDYRSVTKLAILGTGRQGLSHVQALVSQYPNITNINVWNRTGKMQLS